jgi:hypothetical protein
MAPVLAFSSHEEVLPFISLGAKPPDEPQDQDAFPVSPR